MTVKYGRTGTNNWSADASWSTTSGGTADTVKPTSSDDVILDSNSGAFTIDTSSVCRSLDCTSGTGTYAGTLAHNGVLLQIGDGTAGAGNVALKFTAGMAYTTQAASSLVFGSTNGTQQTITGAGKSFRALTLNGVGGSWKLNDANTVLVAVTLTNGSFDTNNQTCTWGNFTASNSNTKSLTLGTSAITCSGASGWTLTSTGTTLSAASSTITLSGAAAQFGGGAVTSYGTLSLTGSGNVGWLNSNVTLVNLTRTATAVKTDGITFTFAPTITGALTLQGNSVSNRLIVNSGTQGTAVNVSSANAPTLSNVDFRDITATGAGGTWTGTSLGNALGNTNITFDTPVDQYYGSAQLTGSYLLFNGVTGHFASTVDSVALSITGDIDLRADVALNDWTPAGVEKVVCKRSSNNRSYQLSVNADGTLRFTWATTAVPDTDVIKASTIATGAADGSRLQIRVTLDVDNGAAGNDVIFYTKTTGALSSNTGWTQLGTTVTTAGTTDIKDGNSALTIGTDGFASQLLEGKIYRAIVMNGIAGTIVYDADFTIPAAGTASFTESSAQTATVTIINAAGTWSGAGLWTSRVPLPQDNVFITTASVITITQDMSRMGANINCTGFLGTLALNSGGITNGNYGNWTSGSGMTMSGSTGLTFAGRSTHTITSNGVAFTPPVTITAIGGTYTFNDAYTNAGETTLTSGTLSNTGNFTVTVLQFTMNGSVNRTVNMGTATWNLTSTATQSTWNIAGSNMTVNGANSTIVFTAASANTRTFVGGDQTYGTLTYTVAGSTGPLVITRSNTFNVINFSDVTNARTLTISSGTTQTILSTFNVNGTSGKLMTINAVTPASPATLSKPPSLVSLDYLSIQDSTATGGASWYAGANSTSVSGNTGWIFAAAPASLSGNFFGVF